MRLIAPLLQRNRTAPAPAILAHTEAAALLANFHGTEAGRSVTLTGLAPDSILIGHDLDTVRPAASTIKIALVAALLWAGGQGLIDIHQMVDVADLPDSKWSSVMHALASRSQMSLIDMASFAITTSDNGATEIVRTKLGADILTQWLRHAGCSEHTRLVTPYTDIAIESEGRRNTTTLRDIVIILRKIAAEPLYEPLMLAMVNNTRNQRLPRFLDDDIWIAHKTGSMNGVVNDVGVVFTRKGAFILGVLTEGQKDSGSTEEAMGRLAADLVTLADKSQS